MAAQALYLKYRPQTFDDVVGQQPITRTLRNALQKGRIRHAYLFTGPRGTGKTTTARLLAKAVNCQAPEEDRPCNQCPLCVAITEGRLLDLIEIDAASNRGIDEIRDIREKVGFRPNEGRYKVYVLDEAHMLTEPAFNALLKTLEEPPPHAIFALVTTDPHKIPATITSRCQRFDFKRIPLQEIVDHLAHIASQEGVKVTPEALEVIARQGTGAMRDAISLLDQLTSYGDEISVDQVQMVLGTAASESAGQLVAHLAARDVTSGLELINRVIADGIDPRQFGREIVEYLRGLLLVREGAGTRLLNATAEQAAQMETLAEQISLDVLLRAIRLYNAAATDLKRGLETIPQLPLEMALVESTLQPQAAAASHGLSREDSSDNAVPRATAKPAVTAERKPPVSQDRRVAEAAAPIVPQTSAAEEEMATPAVPAAPASVAGALTLLTVQQAWSRVLGAVRQRNPTAEGALRSGCKPVEVRGDEVVVTFPFAFLRDKLGDPRRKDEIQDALTEILDVKCRLCLVLESEYTPRPPAHEPKNPASEAVPIQDHTAAPATPREDAGATIQRGPADTEAQAAPFPPQELAMINDWAQEHGGETRIVGHDNDEPTD